MKPLLSILIIACGLNVQAQTKKDSVQTYYYMWSYVDNHSQAWGENDIIGFQKPTESFIKNKVWNDFLKPRGKESYPKQFKYLKIISIELRGEDGLQNMDIHTKSKIGYGIYHN